MVLLSDALMAFAFSGADSSNGINVVDRPPRGLMPCGFPLTLQSSQRWAFNVSRSHAGDDSDQVALAKTLSAALWSAFMVCPQLVQR